MLKGLWPNSFEYDWKYYQLYVQPENYVAIGSEPFQLIGDYDWRQEQQLSKITIEFPSNVVADILPGQTKKVELAVRKPETRSLYFVDENRNPVSDIQVLTHMYWSSYNHCGSLTGADLLQESI